jgi:hypothetical protein
MILAFLTWEIYDLCPLINPSHDGRVVPIDNLFDYLFFNLIAQDILFCKKFGITKITIRSAWSPPPPFL